MESTSPRILLLFRLTYANVSHITGGQPGAEHKHGRAKQAYCFQLRESVPGLPCEYHLQEAPLNFGVWSSKPSQVLPSLLQIMWCIGRGPSQYRTVQVLYRR